VSGLAADLERARRAVHAAGEIALRYFQKAHTSWEKGPGQIVTEADIEIDRFLHDALLADDDAAWLSEETLDDRSRLGRDRLWVVDPIDGTRSFARGRPEFVISVALLVADVPVLGLISNPATGELFEAARGAGATCNGARLQACVTPGLEGAAIVVSETENRRRDFAAIFPAARFTTIGSLAYKLALVAAGRFDAYLSWRRTHDWDIAAAHLLLEEAGAVLSEADGSPIGYNRPEPVHRGLVAAAPALHAELLGRSAPHLPTGVRAAPAS
jgi:myo-inositol-1(or 4)-monophosphatase